MNEITKIRVVIGTFGDFNIGNLIVDENLPNLLSIFRRNSISNQTFNVFLTKRFSYQLIFRSQITTLS